MPSPRDELELVRLVSAAIEKHAHGNVEKLALSIITELRRAGFEIVRRRTSFWLKEPMAARSEE
jgi:hypothetical protein